MARQYKGHGRSGKRRTGSELQLVATGFAISVAPILLRHSIFEAPLSALRPIGLLMLAVGALLLWLGRPAGSAEGGPGMPGQGEPPIQRQVEPALGALPIAGQHSDSAPRPEASAGHLSAKGATRPQEWSRAVFDVIEWRRFEAVIERLFQQGGFITKSQSHGSDGGVDVWLFSSNLPGQPVSLVQCKHWQGKQIGVDKIRELRGVMAAHKVRRGQFATTSTFTSDAIEFARANDVNLLDISGLLKLIATRTPEQQAELLAVALEGEYWRPTCVNCGVKMVERVPKSGGQPFWGCRSYPRCRTTMKMRAM